jgi:hypothetical protein
VRVQDPTRDLPRIESNKFGWIALLLSLADICVSNRLALTRDRFFLDWILNGVLLAFLTLEVLLGSFTLMVFIKQFK